MATLPNGTVTFLFSDIEDSTRLAQQAPEAIGSLLERHHTILKSAIEGHGGYVFQIVGDAFCAAFQTAGEALEAAIEAQQHLAAESWSPEPIRVRMGLCTGSAQLRPQEGRTPDYSGYLSLAHVQRIMSLARGGQILLASASAELLRPRLQSGVILRDLGEHHLKGLVNPERLWQVVAPGLREDFPPLPSLGITPNNLPPQLTSFIGRQQEMVDVKKLLETHRLITLTGSGGTGKTRLALQLAGEVLDQFQDGTWLVELAPIREGILIAPTALHSLGLLSESVRQPLEILTDYLAGKSLLIILDNCEHLLEDCCSAVDAVLRAAPAVKVLATSREALNLGGEQAYRVPSLQVPDVNELPDSQRLGQFDAVRLLVERIALVSPGFTVTQSNAPALAQICRRLDGIPLAIELAAARVKSMPLEAMVSRLDDRFRLLTGGSRNTLPRQQTLRATIDWSYALLTEPERLALQRLSVFRGGWTLEAAELVCSGEGIEQADVLDLLTKLVDKSLLWLDESGRYQMLETVRQYAGEKLIDAGQAEWVRDRHLRFMLGLAEEAEPQVRGRNQLLWLDRLEAELDNLRAAIAWARDRDAELFLQLASALWRLWSIRVSNSEITGWLENALNWRDNSPTIARARALARLAYMRGGWDCNMEQEEQLGRQAYALSAQFQDKPSIVMALGALGISRVRTKPREAVSLAQQALEISREIGDHWLAREPLTCLGNEAWLRNDLAAAASFHEQELEEARLSDDQRVVAYALMWLAHIQLAQGHTAEVETLIREALLTAQAIGDRVNVAGCHGELARLAIFLQDYGHAEERLDETLGLAKAINDVFLTAVTHRDAGVLEWARGNGSAVCEREHASIKLGRRANNLILAAEALSLLGEGHRLRGEIEQARHQFAEALVASREQSFRAGYCYCLQGLGAVALASTQTQRAVLLFAARTKLRETAFAEDFYPFMVQERERQIAQARAQLSEETFRKAWEEGQTMSEEEMLAYALNDTSGG